MKTIALIIAMVLMASAGVAQNLDKELASDTLNTNVVNVNAYFGINLNTFGSQPNVDELFFGAIEVQAYRLDKIGFNFGIYSESFSRHYHGPGSPINHILIKQYVIEFAPTYKLYHNKNYALYGALINDFVQIGARNQDQAGATISDTRAYGWYYGVGLIFDVPFHGVDIQIFPAFGHSQFASGITEPEYSADAYFYKMRFHARDVYANFSIGSSYWRVGETSMIFINVSWRIDLRKISPKVD